jgi:phosphopantothenoylcysteine synthetase/decarboxylase
VAASRTLSLVVCGAGPAPHVTTLIDLAQRDGWSVLAVATPSALSFLDLDALAAQCGTPVRSDFGPHGQTRPRASAADAIIVAPATFNSINKLAQGINDTYALNVVSEAIGRPRRVVILPYVNAALADRRPFRLAVDALRSEGVKVLLGPDGWDPHEPGFGEDQQAEFPWHLALAAAAE